MDPMQSRNDSSWDFLEEKLSVSHWQTRIESSPEVALHFVSAVLQVSLNIQRQLFAIALQQVVVQVQQLSSMLTPDARLKRRRDEESDVVRRTAVRDHLPV